METSSWNELIQHLELGAAAPAGLLPAVQAQLEITFPQQYVAFITRFNGAEGFVGENAYLRLWPLERLAARNQSCEVDEYAPGLVLFGSDGADTAYGFDTRSEQTPIVQVSYVAMSWEEATWLGDTFQAFLAHLASL